MALLALAASARADAVKVQFQTNVAQGQRPVVRFLVQEAIESLAVDLARDDGKNVSTQFGALSPGATRELALPGDAGKHRYEGRLSVTQHGTTREDPIAFDAVVLGPFRVEVDRSRVDVAARRLELRATRPVG